MSQCTLTYERLREVLAYDPETGIFTWKVSPGRSVKPGYVAGALNGHGYNLIKIDRIKYPAHRLAWVYQTGGWPKHQIDHINGVRDDNRWANLREATDCQNQRNARKRADNVSGFKGVHWHARDARWASYIRVNGKAKWLGYFDSAEAAHEAYAAAAVR